MTPKELTDKMLAWAEQFQIEGEPAVQVLIDTVLGIQREIVKEGEESTSTTPLGPIPVPKRPQRVSGVITKHNGFVPTEKAVICLGPWSGATIRSILLFIATLHYVFVFVCLHVHLLTITLALILSDRRSRCGGLAGGSPPYERLEVYLHDLLWCDAGSR